MTQHYCGRQVVIAVLQAVVGMDMIIDRSLMPLNSSRTIGSVRRRDDNSRGKVQNVRGDSSEPDRFRSGVFAARLAIRHRH